MLIDPVVVDVEFPGSVKFPFPPPGSGSAVVSVGTVDTVDMAADDPSNEVALALVVGKAEKSVVVTKIDVDDAEEVGVEAEAEVTLAPPGEWSPASPPARAELACGAEAVSDEGGPSQEV